MINTILFNKNTGICSPEFDAIGNWDFKSDDVLWTDIYDSNPEDAQKILFEVFKLHPLAVEDSFKFYNDHTVHHPKVDIFDNYLFIVFNGLQPENGNKKYNIFSLSCFLGKNFLITIHNEKNENSIANNLKKILSDSTFKKGPDFLLNLILDEIVDRYYPLLDKIETEIETTENRIFKEDPGNRLLISILNLKKELIKLRRISSYQKEVLFKLSRGESELISFEESVYYRNVYDHLVRVSDTTESYKDYVSGILESYLSIVNNKMNEVMKFLTIIATIMLPLTLITGIFGMNFETIPFLHNRIGFYISLGLMMLIAFVMLYWFRLKKWI